VKEVAKRRRVENARSRARFEEFDGDISSSDSDEEDGSSYDSSLQGQSDFDGSSGNEGAAAPNENEQGVEEPSDMEPASDRDSGHNELSDGESNVRDPSDGDIDDDERSDGDLGSSDRSDRVSSANSAGSNSDRESSDSGETSSDSGETNSDSDQVDGHGAGDVPQVNRDAQDNPDEYLEFTLREWAKRGVSKKKVTELLKALHPLHNNLPRDARTLLKTPRSTVTTALGLGEMWYKGILPNLELRVSNDYKQSHDSIKIDVGIDGVNAFGFRCEAKFWPILGCLVGESEPFVIGCFFGQGKPEDLDAFLGEFSREVARLENEDVSLHGKTVPFFFL